MSDNIVLTMAQRSMLWSLYETQRAADQTEKRLSTGRKITDVTDDPWGYFYSKGLIDRAADFTYRKDTIDQAISSLTVAVETLDSLEKIVKQMRGIADATRTQTEVERTSSTEQFLELGTQLSRLVSDASYNGLNLLDSTANSLDVYFSERTTSHLHVDGFDINTTTAGNPRGIFTTAAFNSDGAMESFTQFAGANAFVTEADGTEVLVRGFSAIGEDNSHIDLVTQVIEALDTSISKLRAAATEYATGISILTIRSDFSDAYVDDMEGGADKVTLADLNEEGAKMVAIRTRYDIGLQALSVSGDQQRAIITLLT